MPRSLAGSRMGPRLTCSELGVPQHDIHPQVASPKELNLLDEDEYISTYLAKVSRPHRYRA
jgi:hypothetical protein